MKPAKYKSLRTFLLGIIGSAVVIGLLRRVADIYDKIKRAKQRMGI